MNDGGAMPQKLLDNATTNGAPSEKSYFEQQRDLLVHEISISLEHVLQNLNKLNRGLEGITAVGSEFSAVEALWSHFENVMAKDPTPDTREREADAKADEHAKHAQADDDAR